MKYSVIIPVYNASSTIGRCLDSLLDQPHENAEILLINDGSTDESGEICLKYALAHDCVRYFEKENGGVSSARNLGLEKAAGEYILFVDSDDLVTDDYFAVIGQAMERWDPDMLLFGLKCFGGRDDMWKTGSFFSEDPLEIAKMARKMSYAYLYSNLMTRTFRQAIIRDKDLRFDESLWVGEDQAFIFAYTMYVKRMAAVEDVIYRYSREERNSLSQRARPYLTEHLLRVSSLMQSTLQKTDCPARIKRVYRQIVSWAHYRSAYSACKELCKFSLAAAERRARIRQICGDYCGADIAPVGARTWLIALPVRGKMSLLIDSMSRCSKYCRQLLGQ